MKDDSSIYEGDVWLTPLWQDSHCQHLLLHHHGRTKNIAPLYLVFIIDFIQFVTTAATVMGVVILRIHHQVSRHMYANINVYQS